MAFTTAALKSELITDPKALGYVGKTDQQAANLINTVGLSAETLPGAVLQGYEFMRCVKMAEYDAVFSTWTAGQKDWFARLIGSGQVDVSNSQVKTDLGTLFPNATAPVTRAAVLALATRSCSRAEALFGAGTVINYYDVGQARAS